MHTTWLQRHSYLNQQDINKCKHKQKLQKWEQIFTDYQVFMVYMQIQNKYISKWKTELKENEVEGRYGAWKDKDVQKIDFDWAIQATKRKKIAIRKVKAVAKYYYERVVSWGQRQGGCKQTHSLQGLPKLGKNSCKNWTNPSTHGGSEVVQKSLLYLLSEVFLQLESQFCKWNTPSQNKPSEGWKKSMEDKSWKIWTL